MSTERFILNSLKQRDTQTTVAELPDPVDCEVEVFGSQIKFSVYGSGGALRWAQMQLLMGNTSATLGGRLINLQADSIADCGEYLGVTATFSFK